LSLEWTRRKGYVPVVDELGRTLGDYPYTPPPAPYSYLIFERAGIYYAKSGKTGELEFSGTDLKTVTQQAINALGTQVGVVWLKDLDEPADLTVPSNVAVVSWYGRTINVRSTYPIVRLCGENGVDSAAELTFMPYSHTDPNKGWCDIKATRDGIWHFLTDREGTADPPFHVVYEIDGEAEGPADNEIFEVIRDGWIYGAHTKMLKIKAGEGLVALEANRIALPGGNIDIVPDAGYVTAFAAAGIRGFTDGAQDSGAADFRWNNVFAYRAVIKNSGVNVAVAEGATSLAVTLPVTEADTNYGVLVTPHWNTTVSVTGKTTTGFTINFGTAAPVGGSSLDWMLFRS